MRRNAARDSQKAYTAAMMQVGDKLQHGSSTHLIAFAYNFLNDALLSLWEPVRQAVKSPFVNEVIEEKVGQGGDLIDLIGLMTEEKTGKSQEENMKELRTKFDQAFGTPERFVQELIKYSQETGKTYDQVLSTPEDSLQVVKKTFGSLKEYEAHLQRNFQVWSDVTKKIDQIGRIPLRILLPILVKDKLDLDEDVDLKKDFNISIEGLSGIAESYLADLTIFGKAFLAEKCRINLEELEHYKKLEDKTTTKKTKSKKNINEILTEEN